MSTRLFRVLCASSGIIGVIMLGVSFGINPGPPPNATDAQLIAFGNQYFTSILWGAWLQTIGPLLIILFAFAIVILAGAATRLAGWMTMFGGSVLMTVSLIEITFYIGALQTNHAIMGPTSLALIYSVQHLYFIVGAPALFIPLGIVILTSRVLPRLLGYLAIALGILFAIAGVVYLTNLILPLFVQASASAQTLWWLAAAIILIVRREKPTDNAYVKEQTPKVQPTA